MESGAVLLVLAACLTQDQPVLESFDDAIETQLRAQKLPGASLAVVRDGRLVYAKGYGYADLEAKVPVSPSSLFRIASVSKPVTAAAILKLVEEGKLDLGARAFEILGLKPASPDASIDPRLAQITVGELLHHTGGWNRDKSGDPMFKSRTIAAALGIPSPPNAVAIIRFMLSQPLDFDPGTRMAYSNFGYCVLGRVIEQVTGESYENYVKRAVLAPMGITRMTLGRTLPEHRAADEVRYYAPGKPLRSVFDTGKEKEVVSPYGAFSLEAMDAHGGWLASAVDLVRFASSLGKVLSEKSRALLFSRPENLPPGNPYYACGWMVRPGGGEGKMTTWHTGALPGTSTLLVRRHDGLTWAVLFNERLRDESVDPALHRAADAVGEWPKGDLFDRFK
jgi:CubicO group peptidase (beta-lactamase class C family)